MKDLLLRAGLSVLAVLGPALAWAQAAREDADPVARDTWSWSWGFVWLALAALFLVALFVVWIPGKRRRPPPRTP